MLEAIHLHMGKSFLWQPWYCRVSVKKLSSKSFKRGLHPSILLALPKCLKKNVFALILPGLLRLTSSITLTELGMSSTIHPSIKAEGHSLLSKTNINYILFICLYLIFICIALWLLDENSMIPEHESMYLCNSLISAALGWDKDIRKVSGFCESKV